jgi:integrase
VSVDGRVIEGQPKFVSGSRTLPLPSLLRFAFLRVQETQRREWAKISATSWPDSGYAVCDEAGAPYHPDWLSHRWANMLKDAGVDHVPLHAARHTCATVMHMDGVPLATIAAWLGHSSASFTLRTYTKSNPAALRDAADMLDRLSRDH